MMEYPAQSTAKETNYSVCCQMFRRAKLTLLFSQSLTAYKADRAVLQTELRDLQDKAQKRRTADSAALKRLLSPDVWELYSTFTREEKRRFWRGIIDRIEFDSDRSIKVIFL